MRKLKVLLSVLFLLGICQQSSADTSRMLRPGDAAPSFSLPDYRGANWSLGELAAKPIVVVAFLGTECPLVNLYAERLQALADEYSSKGVAFVGINANQQDSLSEIAHFVKTHSLQFTMLKDAGNQIADQFTAERTPEVFVLDSDRIIRYRGRIDDQFTYGIQRQGAAKKYLAEAIEALLAKRPVATPQTEVVGCHIGRVLTPKSDGAVTYSNQISRILNKRCVECHRPGEIGPFALTSFAETVGWAEMIAEVVREQRMPPWHADPDHGTFVNDARLTSEERELIQKWFEAGAPEGDPRDLPPAPQFVEGWRIGKPDLVIRMSDKPFPVPASGEVRYQYFAVDPGFTEDKWVTAAECRPGNRAVVHHIIVAAGNRDRLAQRFKDEIISDWLAATAPGSRPLILPPGMAKRIPAGSRFIFQMHYTPNGKPQEDLSSIGLIFADPKEVKQEVFTQKAANSRFRIPPGDANYRVEADYQFEEDSLMLAMFPHMHLRGKSFEYTAHYPDGSMEKLLSVPRYDFNWQNGYEFTEPKKMPAGTRIHCVAHFDNSAENWANPDPTATVRWGDQTWEEMMIGYFDIAPLQLASLKKDARPAKAAGNRTAQFRDRFANGVAVPSDALVEAAKGATVSSAAWRQFTAAVREVAPQVDRVCWVSVADGKLTVERAMQSIPGRETGGEGTTVPAARLLLAEYAAATAVAVNGDLAPIGAPDFRLLGRLFNSSMHVPVKLDGKSGVISFWSTERDAFPPSAVELLRQAAEKVK